MAETLKERWDNWVAPNTLEECTQLLLEILDSKEISDEGREFKPTYITSCRVWDSHRLGKLIPKMKELALQLSAHVTDPAHGGKVTCHKCNGFIQNKDAMGYHDHQHPQDFPNIWFHKACYDPTVDYWSHVMN